MVAINFSPPSSRDECVSLQRDGLLDELGVAGCEGDVVVSGCEVDGEIPDVGAGGGADDGVDEVGAGVGGGGEDGLAGGIELDRSDVGLLEGGGDGGAVAAAAGFGEELHGFAGGGVGWDGEVELAEGVVEAFAHDDDQLISRDVGSQGGRDEDTQGGAG